MSGWCGCHAELAWWFSELLPRTLSSPAHWSGQHEVRQALLKERLRPPATPQPTPCPGAAPAPLAHHLQEVPGPELWKFRPH